MDGADGLFVMFGVLRMWQCPHPQPQHQPPGVVLFTWRQTVMLCWTTVGRRHRPRPTTTRRPPIPALLILTRPVTQTPCLGTYPTPKYTNNFNNRVYTTLVGGFNCVFHRLCVCVCVCVWDNVSLGSRPYRVQRAMCCSCLRAWACFSFSTFCQSFSNQGCTYILSCQHSCLANTLWCTSWYRGLALPGICFPFILTLIIILRLLHFLFPK